ncbi:MAG: BatA and WFA domain-containing protein [Planctomycetota bacterium]
MTFLNAWAFWIAAGVVPALVILYFLKLRRREEPISSTLLWKRAVQDLQVNAPFQKLRKNLLLLLQLLVLAAGIFALARPIIETTAAVEGRLVILIDRSASMNTVEADGRSRLEMAKEQAIWRVRALNRRSGGWFSFLSFGGAEVMTRAMVIAFADRATVIAPFTPNTASLVEVIDKITPTDGETNILEALDLAEAYMLPPTMTTDKTPMSAEAAARLLLISDGVLADIDQVALQEGQIELIKVGERVDNVGITALRTRRNYERPEVLNVFLQVENFGDKDVTTDVAIYIDGELAGTPVQTVTQAPAPAERGVGGDTDEARLAGGTPGLSFELVLERAAVIEARLSREDGLAADNRAFAVVPPPRRLRVLVVTERNFFLDSVLRGLPLQERVFLTPTQYEAQRGDLEIEGASTFDVVIFDKYQPTELPAGNFLFLGVAPVAEGIEVVEKMEQSHALIWWDETHPVLRHVSLEYVYVGESLLLKLPAEAETLIEGPRGPVLARYADGNRHYMILSFAIENSTWWQKSSFPVFAYNTLRYLGSGGMAAESGPVRPGDTLRMPLPEGASEAVLRRPNGAQVPITPDSAGVAYYGSTHQVGVYSVTSAIEGGERVDRYAVNLESATESDIRPRGAGEIASEQFIAGQAVETVTPEIWRWFVGAALLIVLLEWYIYNRRVMI